MSKRISGTAPRPWIVGVALLAFVTIGVSAMMLEPADAKEEKNPIVVLETTLGDITLELNAEKAPITVDNFMWYVDHKFYDGLIFHRVISNFMIQGGGFTKDLVKKKGNPAIKNEADNGLKNVRGSIAMARTGVINSATSQFFINVKDNGSLNFRNKTPQGYGYAVFGMVTDGLDVVDAIKGVQTVSKGGYNDVPATAVVIKRAYRKDAKAASRKARKE
ncbi:MAG: peptidylprolyl isomerase [Candidatus Krumholzibacteriia bacterium]